MHAKFLWGNPLENVHLEDREGETKMTLRHLRGVRLWGSENPRWVALTQDRAQWWNLLLAVLKHWALLLEI